MRADMNPLPPTLNRPLQDLPDQCDVLVIGAGPAGAACARWLARAGRQVVLVDAATFPRDKTCGDGLVPDALAALQRLDLLDRVLAVAQPVQAAHCVGPNGQAVDVRGQMAVLPRRELDHLLAQAAAEAGAAMHAPLRFQDLLMDGEQVVGARLQGPAGPGGTGHEVRELRARWVVLATGAAAAPLQAAGVCQRRSPSSMAIRGHVRLPGLREQINDLHFVWHPRLKGGYGWIFPLPDETYNIGVGVLDSHDIDEGRKRAFNLRDMFKDFCEVYPLAARLQDQGEWLADLKGAPLRCNLEGALLSRPGLLVTGEAAGSTYAFTGEGIGKAMETGMAAAEALLAGGSPADVQARYAAALESLRPRFEMYRKATSFNRWPWLVDLIVWRAHRSERLQRAMSDVLTEKRMPGSLISWRGLKRMLLG